MRKAALFQYGDSGRFASPVTHKAPHLRERILSKRAGECSPRPALFRRAMRIPAGNYARARADWEKALQLDPNNATVRGNLEVLQGMGY